MRRLRWALGLCLLAISLIAGFAAFGRGGAGDTGNRSFAGEPIEQSGLRLPARVEGEAIQLATPTGFQDRFWPGVNLGSTIPGTQPGELAPRGADYRRWFGEMGELGVRVVRIYTLLDPSFYSELDLYNRANPDAPLYVIQGVSIPEDRFVLTGDLFDPEVIRDQRRLIEEVHAAVRGDLQAPERLGEAHGRWDTDISRWVIGWSFGIEMDPLALQRSERKNAPTTGGGRYIATRGVATSSEAWFADQLDLLASLDAAGGWSRPITFTNWIPLDPLEHEYEPLPQEDLVSLDAANLEATGEWPGGFFASYHAYPYYPDFLRYSPAYADTEDPYATYLAELRAHHAGRAVMVTEFGVPSSLGAAHRGLLGRDQGDHDEAEALEIDAEMMGTIRDAGFSGGIVFEWTDEWFKRTWNTIETELPEGRRQLWRNPLTNEEHFGVIASEAGLEADVELDGDAREWDSVNSQVLRESRRGLLEMRAAHDEAYLYLTLQFDDADVIEKGVTVGLDVRPGANSGLPDLPPARMPTADTSLRIDPDTVQVRRAAWTDELAFQYGLAYGYLAGVERQDLQRGSGVWRPPEMILNKPLTIPVSGEQAPVELLELGELPVKPEAVDSRTIAATEDGVVEIRVPWAMLGFADPSSRTLTAPQEDGTVGTESLPPESRVGIEVYDAAGARLGAADPGYGWEPWQTVKWSERRKRGWDELSGAFVRWAAKPPAASTATSSSLSPPVAVIAPVAAALGGLAGLLLLLRARRQRRRTTRSLARRNRVRSALLAHDGPAMEAVAREALISSQAQADLAWVLAEVFQRLDQPQRDALRTAVREAGLPRHLMRCLDARSGLTRGRARLLLRQLHMLESEAQIDELMADPDEDVRRATFAWLTTVAGDPASRN